MFIVIVAQTRVCKSNLHVQLHTLEDHSLVKAAMLVFGACDNDLLCSQGWQEWLSLPGCM